MPTSPERGLMKIILIISFLVSSCSMLEPDYFGWAKEYPDCWHEKRVVMKKCYEMNKSGEAINALRVDELMRQGKFQ